MRMRSLFPLMATGIALVLPLPAVAATSSQDVTSTVAAATISISSPALTLPAIAPGVTVTGSGVTTVTTTSNCHNLEIADQANNGYMQRVVGTGGPVALSNKLQWRYGSGTLADLSSTFGTVVSAATGIGAHPYTIDYSQQVDASEGLVAAAVYKTTITFQASVC